jgi:DNA-binding MarR family transcriptional regulator
MIWTGAQVPSRAELTRQLMALVGRVPAAGLLVHQAIAERLGLIPTDLKCLDAARDEPPLTAGKLAEITGLSTSATTAALDRLEGRGYLTRVRDAADRRRVFVVSTGRHETEVARLFAPLAEAGRELLAGYDDAQLAVLADFLTKLSEAGRAALTATDPHP